MIKTFWLCTIALLALSLFSSSSNAMAPFGDEFCRVLKKHRRPSLNLYADNSQNTLIVRDGEENFDLDALYIDRKATQQDRPTGQEDLIIRVLRDSARIKNKFVDGCNQRETGTFMRQAVVNQISNKAASLLRFTKGQKLSLECHFEGTEIKDDCSTF
jgi:hypothetical protein